ncbi:nicotinamide N-methyltransferase-like [Trichosurus vulpecula]|uniref:nicotinamide N-methyltransferase-like n=1 Tax=Trichosurus vulpecula TaxID=9337 RepID=UPI00186B2F89|nr:nicotinamide N-methyltransferase-like [Trichosurus vulpecula]XP_036601578.1 nicotinamide N-methyltransferase-like [Trichosurus vulpecula]XP_036601579.1 nicotinamide N-methyltransferase-like [Trichosurus vulpecula]
MESNFTTKDAYLNCFSPRTYLQNYYTFGSSPSQEKQVLMHNLRKLSETFSLGQVKGDLLIDIGTGPTIYQLLSACESFKEIVATDYTDQNREELIRWLKKEPGAFDWSPVVKYVCELEGDREKWAEKEEKLRVRVKQVLKCDVTQSQPLGSASLPQADCLLTTYCLEAACKDLPTYQQALKNLSSLLKPGGFLVLLSVLKSKFYIIGDERFSCLSLTQEEIEAALQKAGFTSEQSEVIPHHYSRAYTDNEGILFLVGRKLNTSVGIQG